MENKLYKFLKEDDSPTHAPDSFRWPLPNDGKPGGWVSVKGKIIPCENGLHLVKFSGLLEWANAKLYEADYKGYFIEKDENVIVCRKARLIRQIDTWNDRNLRLFACDCAERVLPIFEKEYPKDDRPRRAIETARAFANGTTTMTILNAAWDAARAAGDAAGDAAWDAARAAAWAARNAAWAVRDAAWAARAARDAAWDAARAAARNAAWAVRDAESKWQKKRFVEYLTK